MGVKEQLAQALRDVMSVAYYLGAPHDSKEFVTASEVLDAYEMEQDATFPLKAEIARLTEQVEKDKERIREMEAAFNKTEGALTAGRKLIEIMEKHENAKRAPAPVRTQPRPAPQPAPQPKYDTLDHLSGLSAVDFIIDVMSGKKGQA